MRLQSMLATTVGFLIAVPLLAGAAVDVPGDPAAVVPLRVGDRAPDFVVRRADGATFHFEPARLDRPQILIF